ncbi:MAG: hypothetical protein AAGE52_10555 [Myxococcota bacterium]
MNLENLALASTAIAIGVSIHSLLEPGNIRNRVQELRAKLRGEPYRSNVQLPFTIDRWWKSLLFGMTFTLVICAVAFGVLWLTRPSPEICLSIIAILLLLKESVNTVQVNAYHAEIGEVIESLPSKSSS